MIDNIMDKFSLISFVATYHRFKQVRNMKIFIGTCTTSPECSKLFDENIFLKFFY